MKLLANIKRNSGLTDGQWTRFVTKWMAVSVFLTLVTAVFSYDYYHPDEYFQTLEFASYKLGKTPAADLPWEFHRRMRSWTQPGVYYVLATVGSAVGVDNPFTYSLAYRIISGLLGIGAICLLMLSTYHWFSDKTQRAFVVRCLALTFYIPFILVRTSSEALSTSFSVAAVALLVLGSARRRGDSRSFPPLLCLTTGLLFGIAFLFRHQVAIVAAGVCCWMLLFSRRHVLEGIKNVGLIVLGSVPALVAGLIIDRWGYGEWVWTPWNYICVNLLEGKARTFGAEPFWGYLYLMNDHSFFPVSLLLMLGTFVAWIRFPKHPLTWSTVPFIAVHCVIAHKESRFLFPILLYVPILAVMAFASCNGRVSGWANWLWRQRANPLLKILYVMNLAGLLFLCFNADNAGLRFQRYICDRHPDGFSAYVINDSPYRQCGLEMHFYRPRHMRLQRVQDFQSLRDAWRADNRPVRVLLRGNPLPPGLCGHDENAVRIYPTASQLAHFQRLSKWIRRYEPWLCYEIRPPDGTSDQMAVSRLNMTR